MAAHATAPPLRHSEPKVKVVQPFLRGPAAAKAYYTNIAGLSGGGVSAGQVHTVLDGLRKVCIKDLRLNAIFKLHGIANFMLKPCRPNSTAKEVRSDGWKFTARPTPVGRRHVRCNTLKEIENEILR